MKYRPEIDGLRAVAVVPVILFHAGFATFSGGFVGVDVFFVISGYLITTILIDDLAQRRFSLLRFYDRRARRILPALFLVMLVCLPFAWMWMVPAQLKDFSASLAAVSLFISNILFISESGYFAAAAEEKPLLHTWSLAVEEQYYLIFPLLLAGAWRFGRRVAFWGIVAVAMASLALSEWGWRNEPVANFYLILSRAWELLAGSIAAFVVHRRGVTGNGPLALLGLAAILASVFVYDDTVPFPSVYALLPVLGTVLVVLFATPTTLSGRLLGQRALVGIGLVSYSAYLWHQPLFAFARIRAFEPPSALLLLGLAVASFGLAVLSWKYVETPFRRRSASARGSWGVMAVSVLGLGGFFALGYVGFTNNGMPHRFERVLEGDVGHVAFHALVDDRFTLCEPPAIAALALIHEGMARCQQTREGPADIVLLGDSHAEHLFPGLAEHLSTQNVVYYITGAPVETDTERDRAVMAHLLTMPAPKTILFTMFYADRIKDTQAFPAQISQMVAALRDAGHDVVLMGDVPWFDVHPQDCLYASDPALVERYCRLDRETFEGQKAIFEPVLRKVAQDQGVDYLPVYDTLCDEATCHMIKDGTILFRDKHHLNIPGSRLVGAHVAAWLNQRQAPVE